MPPSTAHPFVNRKDELKLINDKIGLISNKQRLFDFILLVSGIPGIGKSSLLDYVEQQTTQLQFKVALIDLEKGQIANKEQYLYEELARQLFAPNLSWQTALANYQYHGAIGEDGRHRDSLVNQFIDSFSLALKLQPIILLIDNSHYLDETSQRILEEILDNVRDLSRLFVILAGRADLRWHNFELNRRTRHVNLVALEKKQAIQLIDQAYAPLAESFYQITKGYPMALVQANEWVKETFKANDPHLVDKVKNQEGDLVHKLIEDVFVQHVLNNISDLEAREQFGEIIRLVSPLRRFDDYLLFTLLPQLNKTSFENINTLDTRSYIRQMSTQTYLIKWESGRQGYSVDKSMRQLLTLGMKYGHFERLIQIHEIMVMHYKNAITEVKQKPPSVIYFLEQLYHELQLRLLRSSSDNLESEVREQIEYHFKDYKLNERIHFFEEFKQDVDLEELLGDVVYARFLVWVEQLVNESV